jgi:acetoacetate decarboxylase
MRIEPDKVYNMPLVAGPLFEITDRPRYVYKHVENLILQYQTDPDAIQNLLPECYQVGKEPTVTLVFSHNDGVEFLAGRGYRIATIMVSARFDGETDHEEGNYIVVMFEDDTLPIIGGREHLGVPKIYADISPVKTLPGSGRLRCEVSLWGHLLYGVEFSPLKEQNAIVRRVANRTKIPSYLCYKYIPALDGPPDASYPTLWRMDTHLDQLWFGKKGEVYFGDPGEEDVSYYAQVIRVLSELPVRKVTQAIRARGSGLLRYDLYRRLK